VVSSKSKAYTEGVSMRGSNQRMHRQHIVISVILTHPLHNKNTETKGDAGLNECVLSNNLCEYDNILSSVV
ncbi:hypothetical protein ACJX0J_009529, partial [Zea mays]